MRARVAAAICARSDFESEIPWFAKLLWLQGFPVWLRALVQPKCNQQRLGDRPRTRAHSARGAASCWRCGLLAIRPSRYARACDETVAGLTRRRCGLAGSVTFVT
jgi:hypothetical protein